MIDRTIQNGPNQVRALYFCTWRKDGNHTSINHVVESVNYPDFIYLQREGFVRSHSDKDLKQTW